MAIIELTRSYRVGKRIVTWTFPKFKRGEVSTPPVKWTPDFPAVISSEEMKQYREGRAVVLAEWCKVTGNELFVVEV